MFKCMFQNIGEKVELYQKKSNNKKNEIRPVTEPKWIVDSLYTIENF